MCAELILSRFYHGVGKVDVGSHGPVMQRLKSSDVVAQSAFGRFAVALHKTS